MHTQNRIITYLSGYELMWMMVLFDLPVVDKADRKKASGFRTFLLDEGFQMSQYSVYLKLLSGKEAVKKYSNKITQALPDKGKVDIICITDKQYENIISFSSSKKQKKNPTQQFILF